MARPASITREEIAQKAKQLFLRQGIAQTEMKHIAEACGISRTTLYRYFDSKEAIATGLVKSILYQMFEGVRLVDGAETGYACIAHTLTHLVAYMKAHPEQIRLLDDYDCYFSDSTPEDTLAQHSRAYPAFLPQQEPVMSNLLRRGIADGSLRGDIDPPFYGQYLTNTLLGVAQRVLPRRNILKAEQGYGDEYLDETLAMLLRDIRAR